MAKPLAKTFRAALERVNSPLKWVIIRIPFDVYKLWGTRGVLRVKGEINGFAFRTSLFPTGKGGHIMLVNKRTQAGARAVPGAIAQFRLEPDTEERNVTVPGELKRILAEHRPLRRWYDRLNYSMRKEIGDWITQVKSAPLKDGSACPHCTGAGTCSAFSVTEVPKRVRAGSQRQSKTRWSSLRDPGNEKMAGATGFELEPLSGRLSPQAKSRA